MRKKKCDHDCLHCKYPDCIMPDSDAMTPDERSVLHGALGGWERDILDRRVAFLSSIGVREYIISALLHHTVNEIESAKRRNKIAARVGKRKAAETLHTKSITA